MKEGEELTKTIWLPVAEIVAADKLPPTAPPDGIGKYKFSGIGRKCD